MKLSSLAALAAASGLTSLWLVGCSHQETAAGPKPAAGASPPPSVVVAPVVPPIAALPAPAVIDASAAWDAIGGLPYDQRAAFVAGMGRMESLVDSQIAALKQKRATMASGTTDWDLAMGSLIDARNYLHSMVTEVNALTTPDAWDQEKDRVHQAWVRAEDAYDKVRTSTTN
jgi:hypothetical protein